MPYQYDSVIADPIFSKKLLESEVAPASEEHLTAKIEILYLALEKNQRSTIKVMQSVRR